MGRGRGREHTRNATQRERFVAPPWGACQVGLRAAPEAHMPLPNRGRDTPSDPEGGALTRTRGHATPRSGPPRGAEKLVEAALTGANPGGEIRSRQRSISHEDFDRRIENLGKSPWRSIGLLQSKLIYVQGPDLSSSGRGFLDPWQGPARTPRQGPWPVGHRSPEDRLFLGRVFARRASSEGI